MIWFLMIRNPSMNPSKAESKITGSAELQLLQTRLNSLAEEMRLSIENSKRWAEQERERTNREMNDNIRDAINSIERDSKDLKVPSLRYSSDLALRISSMKLQKS